MEMYKIHLKTRHSTRVIQTQKGLGIVEVMAATTILSIIAVGAASFIPSAFRSNQDSRDMTATTQTMNDVMEALNNIPFENIRPYPFVAEPEYTSAQPLAVMDTTALNASAAITVCLKRAEGSTQCAPNTAQETNQLTFPQKVRLNNRDYRVDLVVYKGKHAYLADIPSSVQKKWDLGAVSQWLLPSAEAAPSDGNCYVNSPPSSVALGQRLNVSGTNSVGGGYNILRWTFGPSPGTVQSGDTTSFTWNQTGTFPVELVAIKSGGQTKPCNNAPFYVTVYNPGVDFSVTPGLTNFINVPFNFTVNTSQCPLCTPSNTTWDFGAAGPQTATGMSTSRAYSTAGTYTVRLTVNSPYGNFFSTKTLSVGQSGVSMTAPSTSNAGVGQTVNFSAACTNCGSQPIFIWDMGDSSAQKTGESATHVYSQVGSPTVQVTVKDGSINPAPVIGSATRVMNVSDNKDVAIALSPTTGIAGSATDPATTNFTYQMSSSGLSGEPLNPLNAPVSYKLWFGDTPMNALLPDALAVDANPADASFPSFSHKYATCGTYTVTAQAEVAGHSALKTTQVNVGANAAITASATQVQAGSSISFQAVTQGVGSNPSYQWSFSDDSSTMTGNSTSHVFTQPGTHHVGLNVIGDCNTSATTQITVLPDSNSVASNQANMKKIVVKVAPWRDSAPDPRSYLASAVLLKADNDD